MRSFIRSTWDFLRVRKKYWMPPIFVMTGVLACLIVLTKGGAIASFVYSIF